MLFLIPDGREAYVATPRKGVTWRVEQVDGVWQATRNGTVCVVEPLFQQALKRAQQAAQERRDV